MPSSRRPDPKPKTSIVVETVQRAVSALGRWTLAFPVLYMGLITFLSAQPGGPRGVLGDAFDPGPWFGNLLHVPLYYFLGLFWKVTLEGWRVPEPNSTLLTIAFVSLFGIVDEIHQSFVPERTPSVLDAVLDLAGGAIACLTWPRVKSLFFPPSARRHEENP